MTDIKKIIVAVLGYVVGFLIPLIGFLYGLILFYTKKEDPFFNWQAKLIMIFSAVMWLINMILLHVLGMV